MGYFIIGVGLVILIMGVVGLLFSINKKVGHPCVSSDKSPFSNFRSEMKSLWETIGELQRSIGKVQSDVNQTTQSIKSFEQRTEFLNEKNPLDVLEIRELWLLFRNIDQEIESIVQKRLQKSKTSTFEEGAKRILHAMQFTNSGVDSYGASKVVQGEEED